MSNQVDLPDQLAWNQLPADAQRFLAGQQSAVAINLWFNDDGSLAISPEQAGASLGNLLLEFANVHDTMKCVAEFAASLSREPEKPERGNDDSIDYARWHLQEHTSGWWLYPMSGGRADFAREEPRGPFPSKAAAREASLPIAPVIGEALWADETWYVDGRLTEKSKDITIRTGTGEQPCALIYVQAYNGNAYHL